MKITIKPFKLENESDCENILRECDDHDLLDMPNSVPFEKIYSSNYFKNLKEKFNVFLGYVPGNSKPVVFGGYSLNQITHLFVNPNYQEKGIGKQMLSYLEESVVKYIESNKLKIKSLEEKIKVNPETNAISYYLSKGYKFTKSMDKIMYKPI